MNKLAIFGQRNTNWHLKKSNHDKDMTFHNSKNIKDTKELLEQKLKERDIKREKHNDRFGKNDKKRQRVNGRRPLHRVFRRRNGRFHGNKHDKSKRVQDKKHFLERMKFLEYHKQVHRNPHFLQRIKHRRQRLYDMKDPKWALEEKTKERHHMKDRNFGPKMSLHSEHHARRQPSRKNNTPDEMLCKRLPHANRKCPDFKREVCGSDGVTYHNYCEFLREMCK